jgi:hypothetical protein
VEGGAKAFVVQPFPEIAGALREENGKLCGLAGLRFSLDLLADVLKSRNAYLGISSKSSTDWWPD